MASDAIELRCCECQTVVGVFDTSRLSRPLQATLRVMTDMVSRPRAAPVVPADDDGDDQALPILCQQCRR